MKDIITFQDREKALSFYLKALSWGIYARWGGVQYMKTMPGETYYAVVIDIEKTLGDPHAVGNVWHNCFL
jgi:hypothetical protein